MSLPLRPVPSVLILTPLLAGCASIPRSDTPVEALARLDCAALADEHAQALQSRDAALRARSGSWKAVLPVAIGIRYAAANAAVADADDRLALIATHRRDAGCAPLDGSATDAAAGTGTGMDTTTRVGSDQ